jgi:hypothetical protein
MGRTEKFLDPTHVGGADPRNRAEKMDEVRLDPPPAGGRWGCRGGQATVMLRES